MDLREVLSKRKMVRAFAPGAVPAEVIDELLAAACRAPSAGYTQGCDFVVLEGKETARAWERVTTPQWRATSARRTLLGAPVVVIPCFSPLPYAARYAEADKAASGLSDPAAWPIAFWQVDAAFATMILLLAATDAGLGAAFVGIFRGEAELMSDLGAPEGTRPLGIVALGWPAPSPASRSLRRGRRPLSQRILRGGWTPPPSSEESAGRADQGASSAGSVSETSPPTKAAARPS